MGAFANDGLDDVEDDPSLRRLRDIGSEINSKIGLESAKDAYAMIMHGVAYKAAREAEGRPVHQWTNHMVFEGNPGTGKTTYAKLIAESLNAAGELPTDKVVEVSAKTLEGTHVGDAQDIVKQKFDEARGGVLFIDEAHSLADNRFGREALRALVPLMENHRDDTAVFFAGYKGTKEKLSKIDPGLEDRIPISVPFDDYTPAEQTKILSYFAERADVKFEPAALKTAQRLLPEYVGEGNARGVRNAFEAVVRSHARSLALDEGREIDVITPEDVNAALAGGKR